MENNMRKMLMSGVFAVVAIQGIYAQSSSQVLNLTLTDGTAYHFLLADQHPVVTSRNGQLFVTYHYAEDGSLAPQLCFERDASYRAFRYFRHYVDGFEDKSWNFKKFPLTNDENKLYHYQNNREMQSVFNSLGFYRLFHF